MIGRGGERRGGGGGRGGRGGGERGGEGGGGEGGRGRERERERERGREGERDSATQQADGVLISLHVMVFLVAAVQQLVGAGQTPLSMLRTPSSDIRGNTVRGRELTPVEHVQAFPSFTVPEQTS